jgi:hypothetical protein
MRAKVWRRKPRVKQSHSFINCQPLEWYLNERYNGRRARLSEPCYATAWNRGRRYFVLCLN